MSCALDINDIVDEMKKGPVTIAGLPDIQASGVLTAVMKTVDQDVDAIGDKGLGAYGLSIADLQLTGIVKCGIDPTEVITEALADPSVFTGKYGVESVNDLLPRAATSPCSEAAALAERQRKAALQQRLMNDKINANMASLQAQGVEGTTDQETATLAGQSAKFSPFDIIANLADKAGDLLGSAIDALGVLAAAAALIAAVKNADILGKLKGFGASIASLPDLATNTLSDALSSVNDGVDSIVGSSRIPSAAAEDTATAASSNIIPSGDYM